MFRKCAFLLMLLLLMTACSAASAQSTTVMLYLCGTDLQDSAVDDLKEITAASAGDDVQIVVLAGGASQWDDSRLTPNRLNLFTIRSGSWSPVKDWGKGSMGDPDTLTRFVGHCLESYPADRNLLIFWDHGGGSFFGICYDEVFDDDSLQLTELDASMRALKRSWPDFHLDLVGFDACLMATYEVAALFAPYADCMVASQEPEPGYGWYYTEWLNALGRKPDMTALEIGRAITDAYRLFFDQMNYQDYLTLSVIDLSVIPALSAKVEGLAMMLAEQMSGGAFSTISRTIQSMYFYGSANNSSSDMVDLTDFLNLCAIYDAPAAAEASRLLSQAVTENFHNRYTVDAGGLSIYIPRKTSGQFSFISRDYLLDATAAYADFITGYAQMCEGGDYVFSAASSSPVALTEEEVGSQNFLASAFNYSQGNTWSLWDWGVETEDNEASYTSGSAFGYNAAAGLVIAGAASVQNPPASPSGDTFTVDGIVIAGSPVSGSSSTAADTGVVIAGELSVPDTMQAATAYCLTLDKDELNYLSHADLMLYMDLTDEDGAFLLDLGRVQDTWVDWHSGTVYSAFDGSWPSINGLRVVAYDQVVTGSIRRTLIPIRLNDTTDTYLVAMFENGSREGTILGTSLGWTENHIPVRGVTPLNPGDMFTPRYTMYYSDDGSMERDPEALTAETYVFDDDEDFRFVWDGTQTVSYAELTDPEDPANYLLFFRLYDVFGEYADTEPVPMTL